MAEKKSDKVNPKTVPGNVPDEVRDAFYELVDKYGNRKTMSLLLSTGILMMLREDPAVVEKWFGDIIAAHNTKRMGEVVERARREGLSRSSRRDESGVALPDPASVVRKHQEKQSRQQVRESSTPESEKRRKRGA